MQVLREGRAEGKVVAVGECGLGEAQATSCVCTRKVPGCHVMSCLSNPVALAASESHQIT